MLQRHLLHADEGVAHAFDASLESALAIDGEDRSDDLRRERRLVGTHALRSVVCSPARIGDTPFVIAADLQMFELRCQRE